MNSPRTRARVRAPSHRGGSQLPLSELNLHRRPLTVERASLQQNWKRLKERVVTISPDQRCERFRGGGVENEHKYGREK
ncbi:hypothetical protein F2P81_004802 [Scophthalmus maximus]|uniref:Uncharacterized protein n=1 Tax=Scophthalmus maximus TaxID=52904 RepID=A0A6A4TE53_SCOMX|nr:hypothetical protein F2P81_004802 [Scophthalmus maximus]